MVRLGTATVVCEAPKRPDAAKAFGSRLAISKTWRGLGGQIKSATLGKHQRVVVASLLSLRGNVAVFRTERVALSKRVSGGWPDCASKITLSHAG